MFFWGGGPGPRLSAEHHLEMVLLEIARLEKLEGALLGSGWWEGVKILTGGLRAFAS